MNQEFHDLDSEVAGLGQRLTLRAADLPDALRDAAQTSLNLLGLRPDKGEGWSKQFTPLVLLYPSLQVEGLDGLDENDVRAAGEAHALLLIHAFIEDRLLDKQLQPDKATALFGSYALWEANSILLLELQADETFKKRLNSILSEYWGAQNARYTYNDDGTPFPLAPERTMEIASARAGLGFIATLALVGKVPGNEDLFETTNLCFKRVVTALQWLDDLDDWREDLDSGDENLLLLLLEQQSGLNAYDHPATGARDLNVAHALLNNAIFEAAAERAAQLFSEVRISQRQLDCPTMEALIGKRLEVIPSLLKKGKSKAQSLLAKTLESRVTEG